MGTPIKVYDCVLVQTATPGTGTYQLGAALPGWLTPAQAGAVNGTRVTYKVQDDLQNPTMWEVVEGVYTAGSPPQLTRATVRRNQDGNQSPVNWPAGTRYIFLTASADRLPMLDTEGKLPVSQLPAPLIAQLFSTATQSIPSATSTQFLWNSPGTDTIGAAGSGGFTVPSLGIYRVTLNMSFGSGNGTGVRGVSLLAGGVERAAPLLPGTLARADFSCSFEAPMPAGTFIQAFVSQDSGAAIAVGGNARTNFSLIKLG